MEASDFWNDQNTAQQTVREASRLKGKLHPFLKLEERLQNIEAGVELAREFDDVDSAREAITEFLSLEEDIDSFELVTLLDKPSDPNNAYLSIQAGAGGTEAFDWAQMLQRMYIRWADSRGFKVSITDEQEGEGAGISSTSIKIEGEYAYATSRTSGEFIGSSAFPPLMLPENVTPHSPQSTALLKFQTILISKSLRATSRSRQPALAARGARMSTKLRLR